MSLRILAVAVPMGILAACTAKEEKSAAPSMSSAAPVVQAYIEAWNKHDSAAFDTLVAQDGTHEDVAHGMVSTGPAGVKGMMASFLGMEPDYEWKITDIFDKDSKVAVSWTWKGTYTGPDPWGKMVTKMPVSGKGASVVEVENGKIKRFTDYYDDASFFPKPHADSARKSG